MYDLIETTFFLALLAGIVVITVAIIVIALLSAPWIAAMGLLSAGGMIWVFATVALGDDW